MAEDQEANMHVLKQQLAKINLTDYCDFVYNGQDIVERVQDLVKTGTQVSFILTDFMMPRLNGIEAIEKVRTFI